MRLALGTKLGPYEIVAPLGAGGMGEVYRARDTTLARDVAIKVVATFQSHDPDRLRRFEQEARAAAALNHPIEVAPHTFEAVRDEILRDIVEQHFHARLRRDLRDACSHLSGSNNADCPDTHPRPPP